MLAWSEPSDLMTFNCRQMGTMNCCDRAENVPFFFAISMHLEIYTAFLHGRKAEKLYPGGTYTDLQMSKIRRKKRIESTFL